LELNFKTGKMDSLQIYISCNTNSTIIKQAWVDMFAQTIQSLIIAKTDVEVNVITSFNESSQEEIVRSNFAFMIISSDYYKSSNISDELDSLKQVAQNENASIFRLVFTSDDSGINNDGIEAINHDFFLDDPFAHIDLSTEEGYFNEKAFWLKLIDLSNLMVPHSRIDEHFNYKIFMAHPSPDIIQEWESVKRELIHLGYEVITASSINSKAELNRQTLEGFEKTNLIIHMIGGEKSTSRDNVDVVMEQVALAASYSEKTGMERRLIWLPDSIVIRDEQQRHAIEKMKRDNKALRGAEVIQTPIESFKALLQQRIHKSEEKRDSTKKGKQIYVMYPPQMEKESKELVGLIKNTSIEVFQSMQSNNKSEMLRHHWQSLLSCDMVALFYNYDQQEWVNSKRKDIIKASGFGRVEPISKKILIKAGRENIDNQELQDFIVIDITNMNEIEKHLRD
jgi:hypothetical protein